MSETATTTPAAPAPGSDQATAPAPEATVPEGYVPLTEVEKAREEGRRIAQSEYDRREAERKRAEAAAAAAASAGTDASGTKDPGSDLESFRRQILTDVTGVISLTQASEKIRAEFEYADPALFTPERLATFGSPESLRIAAEDSHRSVAAILDAKIAEREAALREELAQATGGAGGSTTSIPGGGGDPTPEQLAAMDVDEMNRLEAANPGVIDRVMARMRG